LKNGEFLIQHYKEFYSIELSGVEMESFLLTR